VRKNKYIAETTCPSWEPGLSHTPMHQLQMCLLGGVPVAHLFNIKVLFVVVIGKAINVNENKGNNKITGLRTIFRRESQKGQTQMDNQETPHVHFCD
jgi:hypothetical protein